MRELRALLVANDGLGAGHVARAIAVGKALSAWGEGVGRPVRWLLATTSEADALLDAAQVTSVRLPSPHAAQRQGLPLSAFRRLNQEIVRGIFDGFGPELLVVDTFPAGPHLELTPLIERAARRVLIQRTVASDAHKAPELTTGRGLYHATIAPDDPLPLASPWRGVVAVPPIVLRWPALGRDEARAALGLGADERAALVLPGGGGDAEAVGAARELAGALGRRGYRAVVAAGPLARWVEGPEVVRRCPISPYFAAFDVAVAAAGYNSAHELACAGVRAALFARPRPFDDQGARARRFERAGLAVALGGVDEASLDEALPRLCALAPPSLRAGGAEAAAEAIGRLVLGG